MNEKVYLDTSVYNRPFDDQKQARIWLETLAFSIILQLIENHDIQLITSSVLAYETSRNPFQQRREWQLFTNWLMNLSAKGPMFWRQTT